MKINTKKEIEIVLSAEAVVALELRKKFEVLT